MSLKITVVDEQTGDTDSRRIAEGDYVVIAADPCYVDNAAIKGKDKKTHIITIKNFDPQELES